MYNIKLYIKFTLISLMNDYAVCTSRAADFFLQSQYSTVQFSSFSVLKMFNFSYTNLYCTEVPRDF